MVTESVLARIADNPRLPTPPAVALRVLEAASQANCTIGQIGKIITHDPGLCGKMLKLVNSTFFGLHRPVTSIERALNLLGLNHVRSLVLSLSLPSLRVHHASNQQMKTYWKKSVTTAIVCREMAARLNWADADSEMVAGLLSDLGVLLLQETFPDRYGELAGNSPDVLATKLCDLEQGLVGIDHAEVGAFFLHRWKLGDDLTEAIRFHHRPGEAPASIANRAYLLYLADRIAIMPDVLDPTLFLGETVSLAHQRFGLNDAQLRSFLESLSPKINEFAALIEVEMDPSESFADVFAKATENLSKLAVQASLDNVRVHEEKSVVEQGLREAKETIKRTEEQLRQAQKMEAIGRLAGSVAHDFNNLLTVILGNCELLADYPALDAEARNSVDLIRQSGERASNMTRQLLAFSRKQRLNPELVNINAIVRNLEKLLRQLIGTGIQLVARLTDDLEPVMVDATQVEQVLMNLAVNARDAMAGAGTLTIESFHLDLGDDVVAENPDIRPGRYVVVTVRDTGCGMDENVMRHIFEPFFTTKGNGRGTGLGLATVHGIVRQSGGYITVSSSPGNGTAFHIYLPAAGDADASARSEPISFSRSPGASG